MNGTFKVPFDYSLHRVGKYILSVAILNLFLSSQIERRKFQHDFMLPSFLSIVIGCSKLSTKQNSLNKHTRNFIIGLLKWSNFHFVGLELGPSTWDHSNGPIFDWPENLFFT